MGLAFGGLAALALLALGLLYVVPPVLWIAAVTAGVEVRASELVGMRLRGVPPARIVLPLITARKAGLEVTIPQLEAHHLAGGDASEVVRMLLVARHDGLDLTFYDAAALNLAERSGLGGADALRARLGLPQPDPEDRSR